MKTIVLTHPELYATVVQIYREVSQMQIGDCKEQLLRRIDRIIAFDAIYWIHSPTHQICLHNVVKIVNTKQQMRRGSLTDRDIATLREVLYTYDEDSITVPVCDIDDARRSTDLVLQLATLHTDQNQRALCGQIASSTQHAVDYICLVRGSGSKQFNRTEQEQFIYLLPHVIQAHHINLRFYLKEHHMQDRGVVHTTAIADPWGNTLVQSNGFEEILQREWPGHQIQQIPDTLMQHALKEQDNLYIGNHIIFVLHPFHGYIIVEARLNLRDGKLTAKERLVTKFLLKGMTYKEVARELDISPSTITNHVNRIYQKLEVESKAQLIRRFIQSPTSGAP